MRYSGDEMNSARAIFKGIYLPIPESLYYISFYAFSSPFDSFFERGCTLDCLTRVLLKLGQKSFAPIILFIQFWSEVTRNQIRALINKAVHPA